MRKWVIAASAAIGLTGAADAAVVTLASQTQNSSTDFTWTYQGTLGPDEGLRSGDRIVVFDFVGYIEGSAFSTVSDFTVTTEYVSSNAIAEPGQTDDPNLVNLTFTYTGPDLRLTNGPFASSEFNSFGARSIYSASTRDSFFTQTTKNNPPSEAGTATFQVGLISVPAVPEPATWGMMVGGFGLIGAAMRRRPMLKRVIA